MLRKACSNMVGRAAGSVAHATTRATSATSSGYIKGEAHGVRSPPAALPSDRPRNRRREIRPRRNTDSAAQHNTERLARPHRSAHRGATAMGSASR